MPSAETVIIALVSILAKLKFEATGPNLKKNAGISKIYNVTMYAKKILLVSLYCC